jgi:hypothetical protein
MASSPRQTDIEEFIKAPQDLAFIGYWRDVFDNGMEVSSLLRDVCRSVFLKGWEQGQRELKERAQYIKLAAEEELEK